MGSRIIDVELDGVVQFQQNGNNVECVLQDVTEDYEGAMIATFDPRICSRNDVTLSVFIPSERSPIRFTGRIVWHSENGSLLKDQRYLAKILIIHISRMERRRLDLYIAKKRASISSGRGLRLSV